jgi:hypothetical protein
MIGLLDYDQAVFEFMGRMLIIWPSVQSISPPFTIDASHISVTSLIKQIGTPKQLYDLNWDANKQAHYWELRSAQPT